MFPIVKNWLQSGMSQKAFSQIHQLNQHVFYYWVARYRKAQEVQITVQSPAGTPAAFIHLSVPTTQTNTPVSDISTEVTLPSGVVLRFSGLLPVIYLKELRAPCLG
jgi:transposase-like protein